MDLDRIKVRIREFASRPKNIGFDELETFLTNHISPLFKNFNHHGKGSHNAFTVGSCTFNIPSHRPFVKRIYVEKFLDAMTVLGLYDPED